MMAIAVPVDQPLAFAKHVRHLCGFALLAALVTIAAAIERVNEFGQGTTALSALVFLCAIWAIALRVNAYARSEESRRSEAMETAWHGGACQTALTLQDRVANRLSLTVGYAEFVAEDSRLPADVREQARKALEGALATAQIVSALKHELGCETDKSAAHLPSP
jgi:hypothetical protein